MDSLAAPAWFALMMYFLNWCSQQYWKYKEKEDQNTEQIAVISNRESVRSVFNIVKNIESLSKDSKAGVLDCVNVLTQWKDIYGEQEKFALARDKDAQTNEMVNEIHELLLRRDGKDRHLIHSLVDNQEKIEEWLRQTKKAVDVNNKIIATIGDELKSFNKNTKRFKKGGTI